MSDHPEQPQPYPGTPPGYTPPEYVAPEYVAQPGQAPYGADQPQQPFGADQPPYGQAPYGQGGHGQNAYGQNPYGAPAGGQFAQPGFGAPPYGAPTHYQGGAGFVDTLNGPRGLSLASMIIGLASLFLAGWLIVPQIVGIVLGHLGVSKESPQGRPFAITGLITNYLALLIYGALYGFVIFGIAMMGFDSSPSSDPYSSILSGV